MHQKPQKKMKKTSKTVVVALAFHPFFAYSQTWEPKNIL